MTQEHTLRLTPRDAADEQGIRAALVQEKGLDPAHLNAVQVLKRSIDARGRGVHIQLTVRAYIDEQPPRPQYMQLASTYCDVSDHPQAIVVGAGPGGLFAALRLIQLGIRPIVVERGKNVRDRKRDLARISRTHTVDAESNYSFGEGGAGAYSDGKLYTRSKKRGNVQQVLDIFCLHGAPQSILTDAHPHIGTDKLPGVIEQMRETILRCGGEVHFQTRMTGLLIRDNDRVCGITCHTGQQFLGPVILATGHSARDVYRYLYDNGIEIEAKGLAIGVRLEHPSHLIDCIQYHSSEGRGRYLPAAEYSFVTQSQGRGVYSFCMCPGGVVVPAASASGQVVVNGMSPSHRSGRWSNSGMVVEVRPEDLSSPTLSVPGDGPEPTGVLGMMHLQERLEHLAWLQGGQRQTAPAQRMADFVNGRLSSDLPPTSYTPGVIASPLHFWMPPFLSRRLQDGFRTFGRQARGFLTNHALMLAVETRTSAPVRIVRHTETLQHVRLSGLYPCGEGAGYAGGIVSAAIDGMRCAEALHQFLHNT